MAKTKWSGEPGAKGDPLYSPVDDLPGELRKDIPMRDVVRKCGMSSEHAWASAGVSVRRWKECQKFIGADFDGGVMRPPSVLKDGPDLITSSFAAASAAKCGRQAPVKDMVPSSKEARVCEATGRVLKCSEVTFLADAKAREVGLPPGPAVRLCPRPGVEGPLISVRGAQASLDASRNFCRTRVAPKGAPIGWAGDVTLEHPEGEPEEIV